MEKILIVHTQGIGDWLMFTPALRCLREAFPRAQLEVILGDPGTPQIVRLYPEVRLRAAFNMSKNHWPLHMLIELSTIWGTKYDALIFTAGINSAKADKLALFIRAGQKVALSTGDHCHRFINRLARYDHSRHMVENNLQIVSLLGIKGGADPSPYLPFPGAPVAFPGSVLIHPGSGPLQKVKRWPASRFAETAKGLLSQGRKCSVILGPAESELFPAFAPLEKLPGFTLYRNLSFNEVLKMISSHETLCNSDSGLGHIAAALGRRTVSIFGPANPRAARPYSRHSTVITTSLDLPCMPCWGVSYGCPEPVCLLSIPPAKLLQVL
ncbi:MAG: glycosyltransferase family 9 protein [Desulfobaccales bacterium]